MNNVFPSLEYNWNHDTDGYVYQFAGGITKRELFAGMAMQGLLAGDDYEFVVQRAVHYADALLAELAK